MLVHPSSGYAVIGEWPDPEPDYDQPTAADLARDDAEDRRRNRRITRQIGEWSYPALPYSNDDDLPF